MAKKEEPAVKALYHSDLVKLGPVQVTVDGPVQETTTTGKPPKKVFVVFLSLTYKIGAEPIGGEKRMYVAENQACADFWAGQEGRTFTVIAEGRMAQATLTYVGEPGTSLPPKENPVPTAPPVAQAPAAPAAPAADNGTPETCTGTAAPYDRPAAAPPATAAALPPTAAPSPYKCVQVRFDRKLGLPDYSSVSVGISIDVQEGGKAGEALSLCKKSLDAWLDKNYPGQRPV